MLPLVASDMADASGAGDEVLPGTRSQRPRRRARGLVIRSGDRARFVGNGPDELSNEPFETTLGARINRPDGRRRGPARAAPTPTSAASTAARKRLAAAAH